MSTTNDAILTEQNIKDNGDGTYTITGSDGLDGTWQQVQGNN